jgi:hypothetical protein
VNVKVEQGSGWPSTLVDPVQDIDATEQADV